MPVNTVGRAKATGPRDFRTSGPERRGDAIWRSTTSRRSSSKGICRKAASIDVACKIAAVVPFIVMKGMAMADRLKEKDAWDIYFCLTHHPGGLDDLAGLFKGQIAHTLVLEGLQNISEKFQSPEHVGPKHVADFEGIEDEDEET